MSESTNQRNVGYALVAENGQLSAADEAFQKWLGHRTLFALLPDLKVEELPETASARTRFCPDGIESTFADIECRRLEVGSDKLIVIRVHVSGNDAVDSAYLDAVTGLPDRRALPLHRSKLPRDVDGKVPHALLFLDLNNFKEINDSLGHAIGDQVLAILAERWRKSLRDRDLIVRYGGDEFVVLLAGIRSQADAEPIVARLQRVTTETIRIGEHTMEVGVTVGVALADDATIPLDSLLVSADQAMYAAKRQNVG
jgi:diguanylate cyclase (GGDEF)-like protein